MARCVVAISEPDELRPAEAIEIGGHTQKENVPVEFHAELFRDLLRGKVVGGDGGSDLIKTEFAEPVVDERLRELPSVTLL